MFESIAQSIPHQQIQYKNFNITIKRLDLVHPQISGNKFFKLKYNFLEAQRLGFRKLLTFGGAYSNHIAATAYAAQHFVFHSLGIIRGEELAQRRLNPTLATAKQFGMEFNFVSRESYRELTQSQSFTELSKHYPEYYIIPEGGTNHLAIQGCKEILTDYDRCHFDLICTAVGTGGTITGLIEGSDPRQRILGFSALKGDFLNTEVAAWTSLAHWDIIDHYCCGGYAKTTPALFRFIDEFEQQYDIPLEQVYTAKMMMGLFDLIDQGHFSTQTRILAIHTGGLQGRIKVD